jgi:gamma-glutamyl:cysteine ligase YbdK (ATP-grasp superfamily)
MKVNRPGDPLTGSTDPLDPRDLQNVVKGERFEAVLSELEAQAGTTASNTVDNSKAMSATRAALARIAKEADLANASQALSAVRESARFMIGSRLSDQYRATEEGERVIEGLSEYVASDPLLKSKILSILQKVKPT